MKRWNHSRNFCDDMYYYIMLNDRNSFDENTFIIMTSSKRKSLKRRTTKKVNQKTIKLSQVGANKKVADNMIIKGGKCHVTW